VPLSKQICLRFHPSQCFLFRPFRSSKLDHTICPDLLRLEVLKNQFLSDCNRYCHRQHYLQSNSKIWKDAFITIFNLDMNVRRSSGRDNFKLHDAMLAFCHFKFHRIIACHLYLNCVKPLLLTHRF